MLLLRLLYTALFVSLDVFIFLLLTDAITIKLSKLRVMGILGIVLLTGWLVPEKVESSRPLSVFYGLLMSCFMLFVIHFGIEHNITSYIKKHEISPEEFEDHSIIPYDFLRFRVSYFVILVAQLLAIWG